MSNFFFDSRIVELCMVAERQMTGKKYSPEVLEAVLRFLHTVPDMRTPKEIEDCVFFAGALKAGGKVPVIAVATATAAAAASGYFAYKAFKKRKAEAK